MDGKAQPAFTLFVGGCEKQGRETLGRELGAILADEIPAFVVELGKAVASSGMDFTAWRAANPDGIDRIAAPYLA